MKWCDIFIM